MAGHQLGSVSRIEENRRKALHGENVHSGRNWILVVAVITLLNACVLWSASSDYEPQIRNILILFAMVYGGLTCIYTAFFFWAKSSPYAASLSALLLYLTVLVFFAIIAPSMIAGGIIVKVLVVSALVKSVQSAAALKRDG